MRRKPKIGERVSFTPTNTKAIGACVGRVVRLWPSYNDETHAELPFSPDTWRASVEVEELPENWPYRIKRFAPRISEIEPS